MNEPASADAASADDTSDLSDPQTPVDSAPPGPSFDILPLSEEVRRALREMDYQQPTPVQLAVWDPATRGKDVVVQARTGTGKTASFGLPIVDHVIKRTNEGVQALVLTPTRELAVQVGAEIDRITKYKGTKTIAIYGGASMDRQVAALADGAQLVVGTPGRVLDHIRRRTLNTKGIRLLVLDEADEMLSMGFERELTAILESLPPSRQTLLFSATLPPDIERIARSRLKEPEFLTLSGDHIGALSIQHFTYLVASDKIGALVQILETENPESGLIFCNTRDATEAVSGALSARGYDADWLNGDLPQNERESVMARTRGGKLRFLVATDVAARGIDVSHLTHVINFDFPFDAETYVHRTGRTGRAGRTGTAISLVLPQDIGSLYLLRLTYKIRPVERVIPSATELKTRAEADIVTMLGEALLAKGTHEDDRALARRLLTHDQVEGILAGLLREYLGARPGSQDAASDARRRAVKRGVVRPAGARPPQREQEPITQPMPPPASQPTLPTAPLQAVQRPPVPVVAAAPPVMPVPVVMPAPVAPPQVQPPPSIVKESADAEAPVPVASAANGGGTLLDRPRDRDRERGPRDRGRFGDREPRPDRPADRDQRPADRDQRPADRDQRPVDRDQRSADRPGDRPRERRDIRPPQETGAVPLGPARPRRDQGAQDVGRWQPPAEAGDDEPLLPRRPPLAARVEPQAAAPASAPVAGKDAPAADDADYVELFLGIGRRDGARAQDVLRALTENATVDKDHIRRIRVRDRHAFVAIRRDQAERAIAELNGKTIGAKAAVLVELARERASDIGADASADG